MQDKKLTAKPEPRGPVENVPAYGKVLHNTQDGQKKAVHVQQEVLGQSKERLEEMKAIMHARTTSKAHTEPVFVRNEEMAVSK